MSDKVVIKLGVANDATSVTLTISEQDGADLAHATLAGKQLRPLVVQLAAALNHLEGAVPPPTAHAGGMMDLAAPALRPAWRIGQAEQGDPVIAVELVSGFWSSFSLSQDDGVKLSELLQDMLRRGRSIH